MLEFFSNYLSPGSSSGFPWTLIDKKMVDCFTTALLLLYLLQLRYFYHFLLQQQLNSNHRDRIRASTLCCFGLFIFSSFERAKNLLIMGPNNTKNSSKSVHFSYLTMNNIVRILLFCKNHQNWSKNCFFVMCLNQEWAINSQHNNFKWGNIFAGIYTL